ncbi:MAG: response regulator [Anaerolineae bacterium]|nr:response regulator [Anaerolineae bacterium]
MSKAPSQPANDGEVITILLVDDIPETRENIKKMLAFEADMKVVGAAGTGREGVALAKELKPNIIIMDINMPDMDGIQATTMITEAVPATAVIMMSVQNDPDYLRRAMLAGARNFLTKPIGMEELYNTIRTVHTRNKRIAPPPVDNRRQPGLPTSASRGRPGHIIVVYSPQGGVGTTTVATSLASGLMKEGIKVLLVDADLQFGDVGSILNLQSQSTMVDLVANVDDLDTELFENIVATHDSGLKVLLSPARPELAGEVEAKPRALATILEKIADNYDFIVVDTSSHLTDPLADILEMATKIVLVATPTISCVINLRFVLDLFDKLNFPPDKSVIVLNRVPEDRQLRKLAIAPERIEQHLKRPVVARIPSNELLVLRAVQKAVPVVAFERDKNKSPIKEMLELSDYVYTTLMGEEEEETESEEKKRSGFGLRLGR